MVTTRNTFTFITSIKVRRGKQVAGKDQSAQKEGNEKKKRNP